MPICYLSRVTEPILSDHFASESVIILDRNHWSFSTGIGDQIKSETVIIFARNMQT
jgi:hypothetical protein